MKKSTLIGVVCGILALGLSIVGVSAAIIWNAPSSRVMRGVTKLFSEMSSQAGELSKELELDKVVLANGTENYQTVFDVDIYDVEGLEDFSIGFNGKAAFDYDNEKMKEEFSLSLSYYELLSLQLAVDKTDVYVDIPALFDGSICFDSENIDEQFNNSIFRQYVGKEMEEELSLNVFDKRVFNSKEFFHTNKDRILKLIKGATIEKVSDALELEVGGKNVKCKGYSLNLKADDVNSLLQAYYEDTGVDKEEYNFVGNDVKLLLYLDGKSCIRQMETKENIVLEDSAIDDFAAAIRLTGEEKSIAAVKGKLNATIEEEAAELNFEYTSAMEQADYKQKLRLKAKNKTTDIMGMDYDAVWNTEEGSFEMAVNVNAAEENYKADATGEIEVDTSARSYEMNFRDCNLYKGEEKLGSFDVNIRMEPLSEEIVIAPAKTYPIFEFTEADFTTFVLGCYEKLEEYGKLLNGIKDLY